MSALFDIPPDYVTAKLPDGFSFYFDKGRPTSTGIAVFANALVRLGHRLAEEKKDIVDVEVITSRDMERFQDEVTVRVKIRHRLKQ